MLNQQDETMSEQNGRCMMCGCPIVWGDSPCMEDCCAGWKPDTETEDEYWVRIRQELRELARKRKI